MKQYFNTAIDSVQYAKTQFLDTFVKEETLRAPMQDFVNAQAQFAREVVKVSAAMFDTLSTYDVSKLYKKAA